MRSGCYGREDPEREERASGGLTGDPSSGSSRIPRDFLKLGIDVGENSVGMYLACSRKPLFQTWREFLASHTQSLVEVDFFSVPTIRFQILYVLVVLAHERRRIVHFAVTSRSRHLQYQNGLLTRCGTRSRGTPHHVICCVTVTASSAMSSLSKLRRCVSIRCFPRHTHPGSGPTLSA
jgi:hypothetical protein